MPKTNFTDLVERSKSSNRPTISTTIGLPHAMIKKLAAVNKETGLDLQEMIRYAIANTFIIKQDQEGINSE